MQSHKEEMEVKDNEKRSNNTPRSKISISEIFKTLRTNIQFMSTKGKLKTILVTSTLPGEGKSWVSSNLAVTFAQAGKRVVLIDADMRKRKTIYNFWSITKTWIIQLLIRNN